MMSNFSPTGFYTDRIGTTDEGLPVYLYFDPSGSQFRPVIVPQAGHPYYASADAKMRHDSRQISPVTSAVVLGSIGAIFGGAPGAAIGAVLGVGLSCLTANGALDPI